MASQADINGLIAYRSQLIANLNAAVAARSNGKPGIRPSSSIDGRSVDWVSWQKAQREEIVEVTKTINAMQPFIIGTRQSL